MMTLLKKIRTMFPGTLFLLGTCLLIRIIGDFCPALTEALALVPGRGLWFSLLGLITHQFVHGGWPHLIGNFEFGLPFLLYLEYTLGKKRFLEMYILCGITAALLEMLIGGMPLESMGLLGSSGAIFGCVVGACLEFGDTKVDHVLALGLACVMLVPQIAMGPYGFLTGIAYYAHVGGAIGAMMMSKKLYSRSERL
jgi:membrane associated rhomboid family serine protease